MTLGNEDISIEAAEIVRDTINHLQLDGSGEVALNNGDLVDGASNVIYDQSNNHIPSSRVQSAGLDADTVDGREAGELSAAKNVAQFSSTDTSTDINKTSWTDIPFDNQIFVDSGYTHDASGSPEQITFDNDGKYRVDVSLSYDSNGNTRINPGIKFNINGTRFDTQALTGYVRAASGHAEGSNTVSRIIDVNAGDTLKVQTIQQGNSGTVTLRSNESVLVIEQLTESTQLASDADTLDGFEGSEFVKTDGSTPITSTQAINQTNNNDFLKLNNTTTGDTWDFTIDAGDNFELDLNNSNIFEVASGTEQVTFSNRVTGSSGFDAGSSSVDNVTEVNTTGSGSSSFDVYDSANTRNLAVFNESDGSVDFPSGDITDGTNVIFDQSNSHVPTSILQNDTITVNGGTDISGGSASLGGSLTVDHADTSTQGNVDAGNGEAIDSVTLDGRGHVTGLTTTDLSSSYDNYSSWTLRGGNGTTTNVTSGNTVDINGGTDINTDITSTGGTDTITINHNNTSSQGNVSTGGATVIDDINLDGRGHVTNMNTQNRSLDDWETAVDDNLVEFGSNVDFSIFYDSSGDDLVVRDETNDVDLIRQPKSGPTQFIQGADIGSIEAPEDSLTQLVNTANTSATSSGTEVGYTLAVDNQTGLKVSATSDGSGGLSSGPTAVLGGDLEAVNGETIWDESANEIPQGRLQNDSITVNAGTDLTTGGTVSLGGSVTIDHANTSGQGNVSAGAGAAITDINLDGNGHTTSISTTDFDSRYDDYSSWTLRGDNGTTTGVFSGNTVDINGGTDINTDITSTGGTDVITINHNNTSGQGDVTTGGATVIDDIYVDGRGHVTNMNTQNRSLDDWGNANADINIGGNDVTNVAKIDGSAGNHRIRFDSSNSWIEFTDQSNTRQDIVANDLYVDNQSLWLGDDTIVTVNGGTDINGGSAGLGGSLTVSHADTSSQGNVSAGAGGAITDIDLDGNGHTTSISTTNFDNRYVFESGDTMNGRLTMNANDLYFQPSSSGGSVTAFTFESNTNSGSDFGYIKAYDDYPGFSNTSGEGFALALEAENDGAGGAGPDAVVADARGGFFVGDGSQNMVTEVTTSGDIKIEGELTENPSL